MSADGISIDNSIGIQLESVDRSAKSCIESWRAFHAEVVFIPGLR